MMHHHSPNHSSPILHFIAKAAWLITALYSIHAGLNLFKIDFMANPKIVQYMPYIQGVIGVAGVISLIMLVMMCVCKHKCDCGKGANCTCR